MNERFDATSPSLERRFVGEDLGEVDRRPDVQLAHYLDVLRGHASSIGQGTLAPQ
jgi:hypothetical protein